ncbi:MAG: glycosyltransferase [Prevotella sp.]|nr:glycosyltransferase [Prevotella sp.]
MAKVSVLMAVYNAAAWLHDSIGSLQRQTMGDWQLLCVDDGSTDNSLAILRELQWQDDRITVVALAENGGQAHARNVGLRQATGDYVCFLDADDTLSADALQRAVTVFEQHEATDCVLFQVMNVREDGASESYPMECFTALSGREAFLLSLDWQIHGVYMVRASLHRQYPYDETCRAYSDDNTTRLHYYNAREVRCCTGIYYYYARTSSVTHQVSVRRFDHLRANESMKRQLLEIGASPDVLAIYEQQRWLVVVDCYMFYHVHGRRLTTGERHYALSELRRVWASIDRTLLNKRTTAKFGYRPCRYWALFRAQEWLYFTLRGLCGKNR